MSQTEFFYYVNQPVIFIAVKYSRIMFGYKEKRYNFVTNLKM